MSATATTLRIRQRVPLIRAAVLLALLGLLASVVPVGAPGATAQTGGSQLVYDDAVQAPFQNWSWGATVDLGSTSPAVSGTAIAADLDGWGALYLSAASPVPFGSDASVTFSLNSDTAGASILLVALDLAGNPGPAFEATPTVGGWTEFTATAAELGEFATVGGFWWQNGSADSVTVHFDDIRIDGATGVTRPGEGPALRVSIGSESITRTTVDPNTGTDLTHTIDFPHPISEDVYGLNFAEPSLVDELDLPFHRWGGNATSRYNHVTGSGVIGFDWFFMTDPGTAGSDHGFENTNQAAGADTLLTVPISGWVSKGPEASCGYPLPEWGPMDLSATHWLDPNLECGNGVRDGVVIPGDPTNTSMPVDESFVQDWVEEMVATHGNAASGGVENYALDNEPNLWSHTHSDARATSITRDELIDRNRTYAAAVKAGDPTAGVFGPVLWGAYSYFQTNAEFEDGNRPIDVPNFMAEYLTAMSDASDDAGQRLLDAVSVNFYDGASYSGTATPAYRLESTRSLWDPTWAPADWWLIRDFTYGEGMAIIPRLKAQIDEHYPGTDLAITEYNFGSTDTIDGGLAQVDALGIFGREGVDVATLWDPYDEINGGDAAVWANKPVYWAYRLFRNADGNGARFGETALLAESDDQSALSIYAAERTDGAITVIVANKTASDLTTSVDMPGVSGTAAPFVWSGDDLDAIVPGASVAVADGFDHTFPAFSATLFVIDPDGANPPVPTNPAVACANPTITGAADGVVEAGSTRTTIMGTFGDDVILGTDGPDLIHGRGGNDIICAGRSIDWVYGGGGDDVIFGEGGSDRLNGGPGADLIYGNSGADRMTGGSGDDRMFGNGGQDRMAGQDGDDTMQGNDSSDWIAGARGNDTLRGARGQDQLYGGAGDDEMYGGDNTDFLRGGAGYDLADGQAGHDNPVVDGVSGCIAEVRISC